MNTRPFFSPLFSLRKHFPNALLACALLLSTPAIGQGPVSQHLKPERIQAGKFALIEPESRRIVEFDLNGKQTWAYTIPYSMIGSGDLSHGADIEWLPEKDHFLFVVPGEGVFEINRAGQLIWEHRSPFISHDADRLPDGNTAFVNAWDDDDDPIMTVVNPAGQTIYQVFARDLELKQEKSRSTNSEAYSNTHANAVQKIGEDHWLISMRNYNRFVRLKKGKIVKQVRGKNVHDPLPLPNDSYLFAVHNGDAPDQLMKHENGEKRVLFEAPDKSWKPLRSVERLANGNILITGSTRIGQVTAEGELVWQASFESYQNQRDRVRKNPGNFIYKAAFVYQ